MRILISSSTYCPAMNGQAVFTTNLAEGMAKRGHSVCVVMDSHHSHASRNMINGVVLEELRSISLTMFHAGVYFSPFPGRELKRLFDSFQPEIVHIQDHYPSCRATTLEARQRGIKIVGSNHFVPENVAPYVPLLRYTKTPVFWLMWQWMLNVYRHADLITAQSKASANIIKQQGLRQPVLTISCGIDLQRLYPTAGEERRFYCRRYGLDPTKKIFFFLGRVDGEKRVDMLVQAVKRLGRNDIQVAVAGRGGAERALKRMVRRLGLTEQVKFTGFIPAEDVPGLMNSTDIFVMPSEAELLSISTLEAMACGRPVLLADALALPELVRDGENGYLFKPGDVDDLARLMSYVADHPGDWHKMGVSSRQIASLHSLEDTIRKFEGVYTGLISEIPLSELNPPIKETA